MLDELDSGRLSDKQALMRARKLEAKFPDNLEIQNFIANRLWALALRDEAAEVYERAFTAALAVVPKGYTGQIAWGEIDNRSFLRLAHGTLLGLMHRGEGKSAMVLAKKLLAWCPMDNLGIRLLLGDISWLAGDTHAAMKHYLAEGLTGRTLLAEHHYCVFSKLSPKSLAFSGFDPEVPHITSVRANLRGSIAQ